MAKGVGLTNVQIAILDAMGRMEERENTAADIAAKADVTPMMITRELTGLNDMRPALVQLGPNGGWVRTQAGEDAVLEDVLDEEL